MAIVQPAIDGLAYVLSGITVPTTLQVYAFDPVTLGVNQLPAGVVLPPTLGRVNVDGAESQLGTTDWHIEIDVHILTQATEPRNAQATGLQLVESFIKAVDANPGLNSGSGDIAVDTKVLSATPGWQDNNSVPYFLYDCKCSVLRFI